MVMCAWILSTICSFPQVPHFMWLISKEAKHEGYCWLVIQYTNILYPAQILIFHVETHPHFPWYTQCVTFNFFSNPNHELLYQLFGMVMMYALPLILLVLLYGSIAVQLFRMSSAAQPAASTGQAFGHPGIRCFFLDKCRMWKNPDIILIIKTLCAPNIFLDGLRRTTQGTVTIEKAKVKSIKMTFVITAAFLVCWTPYYVMCIW